MVERIFAAVAYNLKLNCLIFFYRSKRFTDYIYTDIYCKLSKFIGQTPGSHEHILLHSSFNIFNGEKSVCMRSCSCKSITSSFFNRITFYFAIECKNF